MHYENRETNPLETNAQQLTAAVDGNPALLVSVLNTIFDRVFLKDLDGRVTFVNQAFLRSFDLTPEQVLGKQHEEFLPPPMVDPCKEADQRVIVSGEATCLETHWIDPESGKKHYSETHKSPLRDAVGNITGIVGISRDITARRSTEEELQRQKTLLELIVETVPDWIFVKDRERNIVLANRAFYEQHGQKPSDVVGEDPTKELSDDVQRISHESDKAVLNEGRPVAGNVTLANPEGQDRYVEFRKLPLVEAGETTGVVAVCRDLTDWKNAEEQSKRNESLLLHAARLSSLGELAAGIAHEVNQPLFSILNYSKAIKNKLQESGDVDLEAITNWVEQIHAAASRGGEITRRLKSFVRPAETQRKPSAINEAVTESIKFLQIESRDAGVRILTDLEQELPKVVFDRIQIQQVLINLIKNAIDACSEAAVEDACVKVTTCRGDDCIEVSVSDNGPGISTEIDVDILDPFKTTKEDGVGLGLAISKSIIESHEGRLSYRNNEGSGATFEFALPTAIENAK